MGSIEPACRALRYKTGGVLHIHHNVDSNIAQREHFPQSPTNSLTENQECFPKNQAAEQTVNTIIRRQSHSALQTDNENSNDSVRISCNKRTMLPEWLSWATETASVVEEVMNNIHRENEKSSFAFQTRILHIEKVKSYAPHIDHMVLDLKVEPCSREQIQSLTMQPS